MSDTENIFQNKKILLRNIIIVIVIGILINIFISFFSDYKSILGIIKKVDKNLILETVLLFSTIYFIDILRLKIVLKNFNYSIKFSDALYNTIFGYLMANLTPMSSGGQPFQIYHLIKKGIDSKTATNVIFSRFIEFLLFSSFFVLIFIKKIFKLLSEDFIGKKILIFGVIVSLVITLFMFIIFINPNIITSVLKFFNKKFKNRKIINLIQKFSKWINGLKENIGFLWKERFYILILDMILGILQTIIQSYVFYMILKNFSIGMINFSDFFIIYIVINFIIGFIPTPGSSGGIEGIYSTIFIGLLQNKNYVTSAILIWRLSTYYFQIIIQTIIILLLKKFNKNNAINNCR